MNRYIPLNIKTNYSLLNSLININDLIILANSNNYQYLSICDDNMFGVMEFYKKCISNNIKPIIGVTFIYKEKKINLYAKNFNGYQNLCYLSSIDLTIEELTNNSKDLILILPYESVELYKELKVIFDDNYISYDNLDDKSKINTKNYIYSNEIRVIKKEELEYLKYAYMIKNSKKIGDSNDYVFKNNYLYQKNELKNILDEKDLNNYEKIKNSINLEIKIEDNLLPVFNTENNFDEYEYLTNLCKKGLLKRFNNKVPVNYLERLKYELDIINKMGFCNYFLVVYDYVKYAKKNNILVGPGRGSAVGSLCCYCLGITDIDPIKYNLLFERFLNPNRVTMPDIDIDFDSNKRDEVIDYVSSKYGNNCVAQIITFSTLKSKQVLRDVSRIFDYDNYNTDNFIKLFDSKLSLSENKEKVQIRDYLKKDTLLSKIFDIATHLENLKRQTSIHAAGVIISGKKLNRYVPVYNFNEGNKVVGFEKDYLEELGLLKMDFLGLDNLTLLDNLINDTTVNIKDIDLSDKKTLDLFKNGMTNGIFQFESFGMKNVLKKFKVSNFKDLVDALALYRPGPMDNIDTYVKRKDGKEKIDFIHESLRPILEDTYGIIIYQEQIMQIANVMADYTLSEADILRRAMGKKSHTIMNEEREKFVNRSIKNGYSKEISNKVYDLIYKFADFGFNKSHSVGYATLAFKLMYLKAHYPNYFMSRLLTNVIGNDLKTKQYIEEVKNLNVNIILPNINLSKENYYVYEESIVFPLSAIHNVSNIQSIKILNEREENGIFKSFLDFMKRCYYKKMDKKTIEALILSGAFSIFNLNRKTLIENLDNAINYSELVSNLDEDLVSEIDFEIKDDYTKDELIKIEYNTYGFYLSYHPVQKYRNNNINTNCIKDYFNKQLIICLLVNKVNEIKTKKGDKMAFLSCFDEYNELEVVLFPKTYEKNFNINRNDIIIVDGIVERREDNYQLIANNIKKCGDIND